MADDCDRAAEYQQQDIGHALQRARPGGPAPTGECLYCGAPTKARWCDTECRDDWQTEVAREQV